MENSNLCQVPTIAQALGFLVELPLSEEHVDAIGRRIKVEGSGFGVLGLGFKLWGLALRVDELGFEIYGSSWWGRFTKSSMTVTRRSSHDS